MAHDSGYSLKDADRRELDEWLGRLWDSHEILRIDVCKVSGSGGGQSETLVHTWDRETLDILGSPAEVIEETEAEVINRAGKYLFRLWADVEGAPAGGKCVGRRLKRWDSKIRDRSENASRGSDAAAEKMSAVLGGIADSMTSSFQASTAATVDLAKHSMETQRAQYEREIGGSSELVQDLLEAEERTHQRELEIARLEAGAFPPEAMVALLQAAAPAIGAGLGEAVGILQEIRFGMRDRREEARAERRRTQRGHPPGGPRPVYRPPAREESGDDDDGDDAGDGADEPAAT